MIANKYLLMIANCLRIMVFNLLFTDMYFFIALMAYMSTPNFVKALTEISYQLIS